MVAQGWMRLSGAARDAVFSAAADLNGPGISTPISRGGSAGAEFTQQTGTSPLRYGTNPPFIWSTVEGLHP